jgi:hypothetical protein
VSVDEGAFSEAARHFGPRQLLHLWTAIASANAVNRFHGLFHTDLDAETVAALYPLRGAPRRSPRATGR